MFKILTDGCEPTRGSKYSACIDLYASEDVTIGAGETKLVGLGVAINSAELAHIARYHSIDNAPTNIIDYEQYLKNHIEFFYKTHYLQLMLRSSLGKKGLTLPNGVGVIDLDYKDEIKMIIHYPLEVLRKKGVAIAVPASSRRFTIEKGDKIGQITLLEHKSYLFGIDTEEKRNGGFGSSGS